MASRDVTPIASSIELPGRVTLEYIEQGPSRWAQSFRPAGNAPTMRVVAHDSPDVLAERLRTAFDLCDLGVSIRRAQLRRKHPDATDEEIEALLVAWLQTRPGAEHGDAWGRPICWPPSRP